MRFDKVRDLFPVTRELLYFDIASLSPLCRPVIDALDRFYLERQNSGSIRLEDWRERVEKCRGLLAELVHAEPSEIALTKNTSEGVNLTAQLVEWNKGDEVLVFDCDFPTNILPFLNLRERKVSVKYIRCDDGRVPEDLIESSIGKDTRLLSISHVFYNSGYRVDLEEIGRVCSERGVLLHVDAAQSLGAFQIDVKRMGIDFLSAPGFKWLLSPFGTGVFYAKSDHIIGTPVLGWLSVKDAEKLDTRAYEPLDSAARFEAGSLNLGGFQGMTAALQLIKRIGPGKIEKHVLELSYLLAEALRDCGLVVQSELEASQRSGIVCIEKEGFSKELLMKKGLAATVRENVRLSPHIYNNEDDIEKAATILAR